MEKSNRLIPLGLAGLSIFSRLRPFGFICLPSRLGLGLLGFFGGFFIVPVTPSCSTARAANKGKIIAGGTIYCLAWDFAWLRSLTVFATALCHLSPPQIFLFGAVMSLAATVYCSGCCRIRSCGLFSGAHPFPLSDPGRGRDNIPPKGGALFVCNHVSFMDALLLMASTDRPVRFMMFKGIYEQPWIKPFARILSVIPISSEQRPREMIHSLQTASDAIRTGEVVCIFAEGQITRIGHMLPFRRGFERIMKDVDAPIIPVGVDGVWGSIFSFAKGRFLWKLPRRFPYPITINYGKPLPPTATPFQVRSTVQELLVEAWQARKTTDASAAHRLCQHRAQSSLPFRHGRRAKRPGQLRRGAGAVHFSRAAIAENLVGPADGRRAAATVGAGRTRQLCRAAAGQGAGQFELHRVGGNPRLVHPAMRPQNRRHRKSVS